MANGLEISDVRFVQINDLASVVEIGAYGHSSWALNSKGEIYGWGNSNIGMGEIALSNIPSKFDLPPSNFISVNSHILAKTLDGRVFTWGNSNAYVEPKRRFFLSRWIVDAFGFERADFRKPFEIKEVRNVVQVMIGKNGGARVRSAAVDDQQRIWTWRSGQPDMIAAEWTFEAPRILSKLPAHIRAFVGSDDRYFGYLDQNQIPIISEDWASDLYLSRTKSINKFFRALIEEPVRDVFVSSRNNKDAFVILTEKDRLLLITADVGLNLGQDAKNKILSWDGVARVFQGAAGEFLILTKTNELKKIRYFDREELVAKLNPSEASELADLQFGDRHYLMLKKDGSVWTWSDPSE